jgi:3-phenylpropionate/trans-cinnamate dioxygenase ferredoxin component
MPELKTVATIHDIPPGEIMVVNVGDTDKDNDVAIANCDGTYYAFSNNCTHRGGPLGEGLMLPNCVVECPFHGGQFDIRTGAVVSAPPTEPIATYPVTIDGDSIKIPV